MSEMSPEWEANAKRAEDREVEELPDGQRRLWTYGPQVGGYGWHASVDFYPEDGSHVLGCFEVKVRTDGEFPTDNIVTELHGCNPAQLIRFGLDIAEAQFEAAGNVLDKFSRDDLQRAKARIEAMLLMEKDALYHSGDNSGGS